MSVLLSPTVKEDPSEAETVSHRLLIRAGMLRKVAAGVYVFLPLGYRVLNKVECIVREEMDRIGAQEMLMSVLQPAELWKRTNRWEGYGPLMMRLTDRNDREFALGPTHEELITDLILKEVRSYRQLPVTVYQVQVKFRDELRPRFGLMRAREFIMKDAYSFSANQEQLDRSYADMFDAYGRVVERCGLTYRVVEAAGGLIGGNVSQEFMVLADSGEDLVFHCDECDYAANQEVVTTMIEEPPAGTAAELESLEAISTPGMKSVEEVSRFLGVDPKKLVKTLIYRHNQHLAAVLVRGDREVNETKLAAVLGTEDSRLLTETEFAEYPGLVAGFAGPVGLSGPRLLGDHEVQHMRNFVTGANRVDTHFMNVNPERDFRADEWADLRAARPGDICPRCRHGTLSVTRAIEVGHIFQLGTKYSEVMGANFVDEKGTLRPYIMGCYGIGVSRLVAAAIEQSHDKQGIIWPVSIAPYEVSVVVLKWQDADLQRTGEEIYAGLVKAGVEAVIDDRQETAGKKFADADLIGFPFQVIVGAQALREGKVEIKIRKTDERRTVKVDRAVEEVSRLVETDRASAAGTRVGSG